MEVKDLLDFCTSPSRISQSGKGTPRDRVGVTCPSFLSSSKKGI